MKYKPGDKVKIKSLNWYKTAAFEGRVMCDGLAFLEMMTEWCGKELTIDCIFTDERGSGYVMKEPKIQWRFTDSMIDGLVNEPQEKMVSLDRACEYLESVLEHDLGYYDAAEFADTFRKAMEG